MIILIAYGKENLTHYNMYTNSWMYALLVCYMAFTQQDTTITISTLITCLALLSKKGRYQPC